MVIKTRLQFLAIPAGHGWTRITDRIR